VASNHRLPEDLPSSRQWRPKSPCHLPENDVLPCTAITSFTGSAIASSLAEQVACIPTRAGLCHPKATTSPSSAKHEYYIYTIDTPAGGFYDRTVMSNGLSTYSQLATFFAGYFRLRLMSPSVLSPEYSAIHTGWYRRLQSVRHSLEMANRGAFRFMLVDE